MAKKPPAFQMYCNDWLSSATVISMTPIQELAYFRMLLFMWQSGDCSIPNDAEVMARLTRTDANTCSIVFEQAMNTHPENDAKLTNNRLLSMWNERLDFVESKKRAGIKSGESRKNTAKTPKNEQKRTRVQLCSNKTRTNVNSSSSSSDEDECDLDIESQIDQFGLFWSVCPRKLAKESARKAWLKSIKIAAPDQIIESMKQYAESVAGKDPEYIAYPATWLNAHRWNDEKPIVAKKSRLPKDRDEAERLFRELNGI